MSTQNVRILVVDDDRFVRLFVLQALQLSTDYEIMEAASQSEAIALHLAHRFDLVLTDLRMERVDAGVTLLHAIKRHSPDTAVILLTAYATVESAIAAVRADADDYLLKPITISSLRASVDKALKTYRARIAQRDTLRQISTAIEQLQTTAGDRMQQMHEHTVDTAVPRYLTAGSITVDLHQYTATVGGAKIDLTATEFGLLRTLLEARGQTVMVEQLVADVYQQHLDREAARSLIASHLRNVRRKLGPAAPQLVNVRGVGYYLMANPDQNIGS